MYKDIQEEIEEVKKEVTVVEKIKEDIIYQNLARAIQTICILWFFSVMLLIGGFLLFLNQYDFTQTTETKTVEEYTQEAEANDNAVINQNIGR